MRESIGEDMNDVFNSFRLLGYKINELANGYFITQKPDKMECLFDSEGYLIISNMVNISQLTENLYSCRRLEEYEEESDSIQLFNSDGNRLNSGTIMYNRYRSIITLLRDGKYIAYYNDGTFIETDINHVPKYGAIHGGDYWVVASRQSIISHKETYIMVNNKHKIKSLGDMSDVEINNHYIKGKRTQHEYDIRANTYIIMNYESEVLYRSDKLYIDTLNMDNENIIIQDNDEFKLICGEHTLDISKCKTTKHTVRDVKFTSSKEIILIIDDKGRYLLNIRTNAISEYYDNIYVNTLNILVAFHESSDGYYILHKLNTDTLKVINTIKVDIVKEQPVCEYSQIGVVKMHGNDVEYAKTDRVYDYEFRQLLHEF